MSTGSTGSTAPDETIPQINENITETAKLFESYTRLISTRQHLLNKKDDLNGELRNQNLIMNELNRMEETYDQEFLDRKTNPPRKGFFSALGLRSTQDWSLAMFYLFYTIFTVVFTLYAIRFSPRKIWAALFVVSIMFSIGVFITIGLVYYG